MSRVRSLAAGAAALALAATLTGCGSSALSTEDFRKQADKICADAEKASEELFSGLSATSSEADLEKAFKDAADLLEKQADQIDDLAAPEDFEDDVESMLESLRNGADKIRDNGLELIQSGEDPLEDATKKAKDLGLKDCGSDG